MCRGAFLRLPPAESHSFLMLNMLSKDPPSIIHARQSFPFSPRIPRLSAPSVPPLSRTSVWRKANNRCVFSPPSPCSSSSFSRLQSVWDFFGATRCRVYKVLNLLSECHLRNMALWQSAEHVCVFVLIMYEASTTSREPVRCNKPSE